MKISDQFPQSVKDFVSQYRDYVYTNGEENKHPWLKLLIDAPFKEMLAEAKAMNEHFVNHMENSNDPWYDDGQHQGWFSINLHNMDNHKTIKDEKVWTYVHQRAWTEASKLCPVTTNYFKNVFPMKTYYRLRFMLLKPGGYVEPHSDSQTTNPSFAVNISLNNPNGCFLVTEKGTVPFDDNGSVFLFNNYYEHSVINNSDENRFHIILHGLWDNTNEEIQKTITQYSEEK
jgi:hypothetical protein